MNKKDFMLYIERFCCDGENWKPVVSGGDLYGALGIFFDALTDSTGGGEKAVCNHGPEPETCPECAVRPYPESPNFEALVDLIRACKLSGDGPYATAVKVRDFMHTVSLIEPRDNSEWNAAIEAAAARCDLFYSSMADGDGCCKETAKSIASQIRSLSRHEAEKSAIHGHGSLDLIRLELLRERPDLHDATTDTILTCILCDKHGAETGRDFWKQEAEKSAKNQADGEVKPVGVPRSEPEAPPSVPTPSALEEREYEKRTCPNCGAKV